MWAIVSGMVVVLILGAVMYATLEKEVIIRDEDKEAVVSTFASTVEELLEKQNITLEPEDVVSPGLDASLTDDMEIIIKRAFPVKIAVDGKEVTVKTQPDTVASILAKAQITLGEKDKIQPAIDEFISAATERGISGGSERVTTEIKSIACGGVARKD